MTRPLHIAATGMATCVGLDAASSCAAMRARLDGMAETRFLGTDGNWLIGGAVPLPRNWIGVKRQAHLAAGALADIERARPGTLAGTPLILCLAEENRPGRPVADPPALLRHLAEIMGLGTPPRAEVVNHGRPSGFVALDRARRLIGEGARSVLILGVDSYLTAQSITHFMGRNRLLGPGNANGFVPGEAAAAILCTADSAPLRLTGLGLAREEAFLYNGMDKEGYDLPLRGDGMVRAFEIALEEAGVTMAQVEYRLSDVAGEKYFFHQSALAAQRITRNRKEFQDFWCPAESLGNIGAAVVPVMLGHALVAVQRGYAPGTPLMVEAAGDDGACGAAVCHEVRRAG